MHHFEGEDAALYATGAPFAFRQLPLEDCGDGFCWRAGAQSLRCWLAGPLCFEVTRDGEWCPVAPSEVHLAAGVAEFGRCLTGSQVRVSGAALPTSLIATGERWLLEQEVLVGASFAGARPISGQAVARLLEVVQSSWEALSSVRRVLAVLPSGAVGAFVGIGQMARDAAELTVRFDEQGVSYAPQ